MSEAQRRAAELAAVQALSIALTQLESGETIAAVVHDVLQPILPHELCCLFWTVDDVLKLVGYAGSSLSSVALDMIQSRWPTPLAIVPEASVPGRPIHLEDRIHGSVLAAPLQCATVIKGVLAIVQPNAERIDEHALRLLTIVANHLAVALRRVELQGTVQARQAWWRRPDHRPLVPSSTPSAGEGKR
jgi:GAF domain-containing protein